MVSLNYLFGSLNKHPGGLLTTVFVSGRDTGKIVRTNHPEADLWQGVGLAPSLFPAAK